MVIKIKRLSKTLTTYSKRHNRSPTITIANSKYGAANVSLVHSASEHMPSSKYELQWRRLVVVVFKYHIGPLNYVCAKKKQTNLALPMDRLSLRHDDEDVILWWWQAFERWFHHHLLNTSGTNWNNAKWRYRHRSHR